MKAKPRKLSEQQEYGLHHVMIGPFELKQRVGQHTIKSLLRLGLIVPHADARDSTLFEITPDGRAALTAYRAAQAPEDLTNEFEALYS